MALNLIANAGAAAASQPTTSAIDTTGADLLIVATHVYTFAVGFPGSISDNKGNTWTSLTLRSQGQNTVQLHYATNPTVGSGHTFKINEDSIFGSIEVEAWSGSASSPFDVENGVSQASSSNSVQPGSVTASVSNSLFVTAVSTDEASGDPGTPFAIDLGFTISDQNHFVGGVNVGGGLAYLVDSGSKNPTWSWPTTSEPSSAAIAVFSPAVAAAPVLMGQGIM